MQELNGLPTPFRRDRKQDFASGQGERLLRAKVIQLLMTEPGELAWRTEFGVGLKRLRHHSNDLVLAELARVRIRDAFQQWLPSVRLISLNVARVDARLFIRLCVRDEPTGIEASAEVNR